MLKISRLQELQSCKVAKSQIFTPKEIKVARLQNQNSKIFKDIKVARFARLQGLQGCKAENPNFNL